MKTLLKRIVTNLEPDELENVENKFKAIFIPVATKRIKRSMKNSTGYPDLRFLYSLVRYLKPSTIIEIGTWIGSSTYWMTQALKKNNCGHIYTFDLNNHSCIENDDDNKYITYYTNNYAHKELRKVSCSAEFVFLDANLDNITVNELLKKCTPKTIFVTHDFVPFTDKGCHVLINIHNYIKWNSSYVWLKPDKNVNYTRKDKCNDSHKIIHGNNEIRINTCCACLIPDSYELVNNSITQMNIFYAKASKNKMIKCTINKPDKLSNIALIMSTNNFDESRISKDNENILGMDNTSIDNLVNNYTWKNSELCIKIADNIMYILIGTYDEISRNPDLWGFIKIDSETTYNDGNCASISRLFKSWITYIGSMLCKFTHHRKS